MLGAILTLTVAAIIGAFWLAYSHPSAYRMASSVGQVGGLCALVGVQCFSTGIQFAANVAARASPPATEIADKIRGYDPPSWVFFIPVGVCLFLIALDFFPWVGFTDDARRLELREKERATRRPPLY